jgi:site-specific DNA recombinase
MTTAVSPVATWSDRPYQRLLADIEACKIDCVVVYKVDRLSRSLLDFARLMEVFEKKRVAFVSVTQQFNTATSMGRLVLNVLLSFAQFEREIIAERTRDKIAATRRKGKWSGGMPLLGYDVDPRSLKLVVNESEAEQVRTIFALYLERQGVISVVEELERRGWHNKRWQTRKGYIRGGNLFTKTSLRHLLTNVVYQGKVRYKKEVHPGEHQGIVEPDTWHQVQALLQRQRRPPVAQQRSSALLRGLLHCRACGHAMTPTSSQKNGGKRYDYYVCQSSVKRGRQACPARSLPRAAIDPWVVERVHQAIGRTLAPEDESLLKTEPAKWLRNRVQRVDYDHKSGKVSITLRDTSSASPQENA